MGDNLNPELLSLECVTKITEKIENLFIVKVIRNGLVTMIPVLMIGAFALVFQSFPVDAYQHFIKEFAGGFFYTCFHMVYGATFGVLSLYMVVCFSVSFYTLKAPDEPFNLWAVVSSVISFMIMIGVWSDQFQVFDLGPTSVFLAIVTAMVSSEIFYVVSKRFTREDVVYSFGIDSRLDTIWGVLLPASVTVTIAALLSFLVTLTGNGTMHELVANTLYWAFTLIDNLFLRGLCFMFMTHFLWLLGMHGSDCLGLVAERMYRPMVQENILAVANNVPPPEIFCCEYFDVFILMGGCGSCLCLVIAILLFSKNKNMKILAKTTTIPMAFNISELVVFGLPIVYNPVICIPFLLVPVLQYLITYFAFAAGLVPHITSAVSWTTPVFVGGYIATGSINGSLLQVVNIIVGVIVYTPFVKLLGSVRDDREGTSRKSFVQWYIENEGKNPQLRILGLHGVYGDIAKRMALEIRLAMNKEEFQLYYQPQYNYEGKCIGVEALLRWPNNDWLGVYPPLVLKIAQEDGVLIDLEKKILHRAMSERERIFQQFGRGIKISVNVTGGNAANQSYWDYIKQQWEEAPFTEGTLCVEVTEQDAIIFDDRIIEQFRACKKLGIKFAIDDFSAGQTSMEYLKNGLFNMLKIDGALVKVINENQRCREIISSLASLSDSLHIDCLAEYVANEAIRQSLHEVGCDLYQGYLFSPPVPLKDEQEQANE